MWHCAAPRALRSSRTSSRLDAPFYGERAQESVIARSLLLAWLHRRPAGEQPMTDTLPARLAGSGPGARGDLSAPWKISRAPILARDGILDGIDKPIATKTPVAHRLFVFLRFLSGDHADRCGCTHSTGPETAQPDAARFLFHLLIESAIIKTRSPLPELIKLIAKTLLICLLRFSRGLILPLQRSRNTGRY